MIAHLTRKYRTRFFVCVVALLVTTMPMQVSAAPLPDMSQHVSLVARETSASEFLEELFGLAGIPLNVDAQIHGTVNGYFSDTAAALHKQAMRDLKLTTYYDGQVAHVYNANELRQEVLPVSASVARKIVQHVQLLNLADKQNTVRAGQDGGLVVKGAPRFVEQVKSTSTSIRRNAVKYVPLVVEKVFYLKHAWVQDTTLEMGNQSMVVPGIVSILNELIAKEPMGVSTATVPDSGVGAVERMQSGMVKPVSGSGTDARNINPPRSQTTQAAQSAGNRGADVARVVAVPRLNAVLVRDLETRMPGYATLIQSLDVEPYMLEIEATIIDINSDRSNEFGVNWRYQRGDGNEALVGNGTESDLLLNPDTQITPQGQGGILSLALGNPAAEFLARIRALETQGDAEIVSKPHVVTLSNVEAVLDTTRSFFVRVAATEDAALFKITAGTTLRVTPHVYRMDGSTRIKLMVNIQDGATSDAEVDEIPVIGNSTISTQAIITDGDSLLVGGLVRESKSDSVSKVPFLGDIPGLGAMFRTNTTSGSKVERLFLITPRLAFRNGFNKGRRMDAPILQGSQSDIIGTAGQRMQSTQHAINHNAPAPARPLHVSPGQTQTAPGRALAQPPSTAQPAPLPAPAEPSGPAPGQLVAEKDLKLEQPDKLQILQSLLDIPPAPVSAQGSASTAESIKQVNNAKSVKQKWSVQKWSVQALPQPTAAKVVRKPLAQTSGSAKQEPVRQASRQSGQVQATTHATTHVTARPITQPITQPTTQAATSAAQHASSQSVLVARPEKPHKPVTLAALQKARKAKPAKTSPDGMVWQEIKPKK